MSAGSRLRGVTWGHRRAIDPLIAATRAYEAQTGRPGADWAVRDLRAFEHQPLAEALAECELLVFDHPFIGEIAQSGLFLPLDDYVKQPDAYFAGPSLSTYRWQGKLWGAPVDAATMNAVYRSDLMAKVDCEPPSTWPEVVALGERLRRKGLWLGLANGDHHGFLAAGTLMHNRGKGWSSSPEGGLSFDLEAFREALDVLLSIHAYAHPLSAELNSIGLHDLMTESDEVAYCPLTYGYATYGEADYGARRLSFGPFPGLVAPFEAGTLIGGAAVGVAAHCGDQAAAMNYLSFLMEGATQDEIFGRHHGQPATASAWKDPVLDERFNGYFSGVAGTLRTAAMRPRFRGYGVFERQAGGLYRALLQGEHDVDGTIEAMKRLTEDYGECAA